MDKLNWSESKRSANLSDVVSAPCTSHDGAVEESEIIDVAFNDIKEETQESKSDSSLAFKNLLFELPLIKHNFSTKRKQEFLLTDQSDKKRKKIEENADLDDENSEDDEVEKVFNYLTGAYEPVAKGVKFEYDQNPKNQPESIPVKKFGKKEAVKTGHAQGSSTDKVLSKPAAATAPPIGRQASLSNNISCSIDVHKTFLDTSPCTSPVISLDTHIVPLSESQQPCHDDSAKNSLIFDNSSPECSTQIDNITASKNNSILENNSLAEVTSSGSTLNELSILVNTLSKSSRAFSPNENRHPETDTIFFNVEEQNTSLSASRSVPQEVPTTESNLLCQDENSNCSVPSVNSPADRFCIDDSSNDTVITTPDNNLIFENSTTSSAANSSGVILKELYISITPLPISNNYLSLSSGSILEPEVDEENGNSSNVDNEIYVDLTKSDTLEAEEYLVKKSGRTLSLLHWSCKTCGFNAKTKKNLISHIYNAHLKEDYEIKIKCKSCDFECDTPREMEQHELSHAISLSDEDFALSTISSEKSIPTEKLSRQNRIVSDCSNSSPSKYIKTRTNNKTTLVIENIENVILELSDSDGDYPSNPKSIYRQCFLCKFATNRESNLKDHAEVHKGKMYYCEDHFWSSVVSTCAKCSFENIMANVNRSCRQQSIPEKSNKKQKLQNTDQNKNTPVENSYSLQNSIQLGENNTVLKNVDQNKIDLDGKLTYECSARLAPTLLSSVESALGSDSSKNLNISHYNSNEPEPGSIRNTGNGCNLDNYDGMTQNPEKFSSKTIQDLDHKVRSSDTSRESEISPTLEVNVTNFINNKEQENDILGKDYSSVVQNTEKSSSSIKVIESSGPNLESCVANAVDVKMPQLSVEAAPDTEKFLGFPRNASPKSPNVALDISIEHRHSSTPHTGNGCNLDNYNGMTQNTENFNSKTVEDLDHQVSSSDASKESEIPPTLKENVTNSVNNKEQEEDILAEHESSVVQNTEKSSSSTKVIEPSSPTLKSSVANVIDVEMSLLSVEAVPDTEKFLGFPRNASPKSPSVALDISIEHRHSSTPHTGNGCNLDNYNGMTQNTENFNSKTVEDLDHQVSSSDASKESEIPPTLKEYVTNSVNNKEQEMDILAEHESSVVQNTEKSSSSTKVIEPSSPTLKSSVANVIDVEMSLLSVEAAPDTETYLENVLPKSPNVAHDMLSNEHGHSSTSNAGNVCNLDNYEVMTQNTEKFNTKTTQDLDYEVRSLDTSKESEIPLTLKVNVTNNKDQEGNIVAENYSSVVQNTEKSSSSTKVIEPSSLTLKSCVANGIDVEMPLLSVEPALETEIALENVSPKSPNVSRSISNEHGYSLTPNIGNECNLDNYNGMTQNTENVNSKTVEDLDHQVLSSDTSKESEIPPTLKENVTNSVNNKEQDENIPGENYSNVQNTEKSSSNTKAFGPSGSTLESCVANVVDIEMPLSSVEPALDTETLLGNVSPRSPDDSCINLNSKTVEDLAHQVSCSDTSKVSDILLTQKVSVKNSVNNQEQEEDTLAAENCSNVVENTEKHSSSTKVIGTTFSGPTLENCVPTVADVIETLGNSVSTDSNGKKRKSSENLELDTIYLDNSAQDGFAITFKCFDCDTLISKKDELKTHALSCHPNSSFKCNIHESKIGFHECAKCVYELIFRTYQIARLSIEDPFRVNWKFKRFREDGRQMTPYKEPTFNKRNYFNSDSDSDVSWDSEPTEIRITRARASQSKAVTEPNQETNQLSDQGDSDGDTDCDFDYDRSVGKTRPSKLSVGKDNKTRYPRKCVQGEARISNTETKKESLRSKFHRRGVPCFDCNTFCRYNTFLNHVGRHMGSKYQCIRHQKLRSSDCEKCYYESALQSVINRVKSCKCGYRTANAYHLRRHMKIKSNCAKWINRSLPAEEVRCLVCSYRTNHKIFLKYHMVDHLALTLCCKEHEDSYDNNCELCINEECLETAKKEVIVCEKCNLKTLLKQIVNGHVCKGETVEKSNNNTMQKSKDTSTRNAQERTTRNITDNQKTLKDIEIRSVPEKMKISETDTYPLKGTGSENPSTSTTQNVKKDNGAKCFDCNAYFPDKSDRFIAHICQHIGSKYQCIKHQNVKPDDCQGCYYERVLKDVLKIVIYCDCGYKTLTRGNLRRHKNKPEACKRWTNRSLLPREMRCLTCQYVTKHTKFLNYHMVDHLDVTLSCDKKHDKNDDSCELCLNQKCLESAKKEVIICEKCNFKTLVKQVFDAHDCKEKTVQNAQESTNKEVCDSQDTTKQTTTTIKAKCFDCRYSSEENDSTFKKHVCRHIGSKYQCIEHWKNKDASCLKCLYEEILQGLQTKVNICKTCGYKTLNKLNFTTHLDDTESCSKWANRKLKSKGIRCFKCPYNTTHTKFLQYHMVDHLDETFSCNVHHENKDANCNKCIYEECLKKAKKEVKTCDKCNFKTAIKQIFDLHNCEEASSKETTQNTFQSIATVTNNEGVETMVQPLGKKGKSSKETETTNDLKVKLDGDNAQSDKDIGNVSKTDLSIENIADENLKNKGHTQSSETTLTENMDTSTTMNDKGVITQAAQCFDCKFSCTDNVNRFFNHVCRHIGSKYQCMEHQIGPNKDCQKCHYESALKAVRDKVQLCNRCGYKTTNNLKFSRHTGRIDSCDKWRNRSLGEREIRCFQCQYVTTHKKFLKYHMVDHLDLTLSCDLHRDKEDDLCATCLNVKSLENAKKEVKICEKCNFKTLIKQVFNCHDCKEENSTTQNVLFDREAKDNNCKRIEDNPKEVTGVRLSGIDSKSKKNSDNTGSSCDVSQSVKENGIVVKSEMRPKCYDCQFSSDDDIAFEEHACRHIGSKYQCVEHWRSNGKNCPKCHYEELLQKLQIKIKACNICGYKTIDKLGMTRHLEKFGSCSSWVNRHLEPDEIRCLQCQYVTTRKKFLKYHMVDHLDVTFSCDVHQDNKNAECEKCIYEECLENAKSEVQTCTKCDLKTVIKPIFDIHDCEENRNTEQQGVSTINDSINLVEKTNASSKDANNINKSNNTQETSVVNVQINPAVKCFDCNYSCKDRLYTFKKHIIRHVGSKFQCMEHTQIKYMDCLKCYYEVTLSTVAEDMKRCPKCGYTHIDTNKINRHMNGIDSCQRWIERKLKPGQIRCFECSYMTTHRKFLKYHMVEHLDIKFDCWEHPQNKDKQCLKCIYEESLEGAKKEAIICKKCKFKTVIKKVFKIHDCEKENVVGKTEDNAKKITCLDCNEFSCLKKEELQKHAVVHYESEFRCDEHSLEEALDNCSKCFYQNIIESVKKSVMVCEFCPFKACSDDVFGAHVCVNKDEDNLTGAEIEERHSKSNLFICYHCEYRGTYWSSLKSHAIRHYDKKYKCDEHLNARKLSCRKCLYEHLLKSYDTSLKVCEKCNFKTLNNFDFDNHVNRNACSAVQAKVSTTIDNAAIPFKCFDCEATYHKEHGLKNHATRHIGSTFKCDEHRDDKDHNCQKCIYEDIVQNIESKTFSCDDCGFNAYTWLHLITHQKNKDNCQLYRAKLVAKGKSPKLSQIQTYKCFDCNFSHMRKDFLVKHIPVHGRSKFQCKKHREHAEDCAQCLYRDLLNKAAAHWVQCFDCKPPGVFTTKFSLKRHILRSHRDSSYVCKKHDPKSEKCHQCQYEYLVTQIIVQHEFECYDCMDKYFRTKELLKSHIKEYHLRSDFVCKVHVSQKNPDSCDMCDYEELVPICESEAASGQSLAGSSKEVSKQYRCFDCKFTFSWRSALTKHIKKNHAESNFSCSQHTMGDINEETCSMCLYETTLVSSKQFNCSKCEFKAVSKGALDKHYKQNHSDTVVVVDDTAIS